MSRRRRIPPENVLTALVPASVEREALEQLGCPGVSLAPREPEQPPEQHEVLPRAEDLVDRGTLPDEPDALADGRGGGGHVDARDRGTA